MRKNLGHNFHSKVLLFGEYSIILGSKALTMPYELFKGHLELPLEKTYSESSREIKTFFQYLKKSDFFRKYQEEFDWAKFQFEVNQGLFFSSNIPQGYGMGSSGAVTASIFHRYMNADWVKKSNLLEIKNCMAMMEAHFHGKSSGLDPFVSYFNKPVLCKKKELQFCSLPQGTENGETVLFLLDTGRSRRTEALVNLYIEKLKNPIFAHSCYDRLIPHTESCIKAFMERDMDHLFKNFYELSKFQYEEFTPMIPHLFLEKWQRGLERQNTLLKLCGAGGGGFLMGLSSSFKELAQEWASEQIKILWRF